MISQTLLSPRVLLQITNYRREWRNPSTHDHLLNFDEDEALLAIVNVAVFAIVLADQIIGKIGFKEGLEISKLQAKSNDIFDSLAERTIILPKHFTNRFNMANKDRTDVREAEVVGALSGFLSSSMRDVTCIPEARLAKSSIVDLLLVSEKEKLIIEVKYNRLFSNIGQNRVTSCVSQVSKYMELGEISTAIVYIYSNNKRKNEEEIVVREKSPLGVEGRVIIVATQAVIP